MALMGNEALEEFASKNADRTRDDADREAGRGVVVLGRSGVVVLLLSISEALVGGVARTTCGPLEPLLLRRAVPKAEGGLAVESVLDIWRDP